VTGWHVSFRTYILIPVWWWWLTCYLSVSYDCVGASCTLLMFQWELYRDKFMSTADIPRSAASAEEQGNSTRSRWRVELSHQKQPSSIRPSAVQHGRQTYQLCTPGTLCPLQVHLVHSRYTLSTPGALGSALTFARWTNEWPWNLFPWPPLATHFKQNG